MVRRSSRLMLGICLLVTVMLTALGAGVAPALGADSGQPTIVGELTEKRTQYSKTYALSNGSYRCEIFQSPVHYHDESGDWRPIDLSLVPQKGLDAYTTVATPVKVILANEAPGQKPVTISSDGWSVTMDLVGCAEDQKLVFDDRAVYPGVAPDTDVTYTVLGNGVKEVLTLASSSAPNTFTYRIGHPGLSLRQDESGGWALYAPDRKEPMFYVGSMNVCDSSRDAADEPAYCDEARTTVIPGEGASTVSFTVPRAWLLDPERVWPVKVDPELGQGNTIDTYLSAGYPSSPFGTEADLLCGRMSSAAEKCRTLVRFPEVNNTSVLPAGSHISAATFKLRCYWQPATHSDGVSVGKLATNSILWGESSTYNGANAYINIEYEYPGLSVTAQNWLNVDCQAAVQDWLDTGGNKGFVVFEPDASGSGYSKKFRSRQEPDVNYQPRLTVDYELPSVSVTSPSQNASYRLVNDTVVATLSLNNVSTWSQVKNVKISINNVNGPYRGTICWYQYAGLPPDGAWVGATAVSGGGYVASLTDFYWIEPVSVQCGVNPGSRTVTLAFKLKDVFGDVQDNDFDTQLNMSSGDRSWGTGWRPQNTNVDVRPSAITSTPTGTSTPSAGWFVAEDTSNPLDGLPDNHCNVNGQGRGDAALTWYPAASSGVDGYAIYLHDGNRYWKVGYASGAGTTSWSSAGRGLYPSDAQIAAWSGADGVKPFRSGDGLDLRDSPNALYAKAAGGLLDGTGSYQFVVVPCYASNIDPGVYSPSDTDNAATVTLVNRTVGCNDERRHTTYELGSWNEHSSTAILDDARLETTTTDLAIASWGADVAVARRWSSSPNAGLWAPGWRFSFERCMTSLSSQVVHVYVDEEGVEHRFYRPGSENVWQTPDGYAGILAAEGSGWQLTLSGDEVLHFDSSGRLTSETDRNGNAVSYGYSGSQLTSIEAANGQEIALTYAAGRLATASYATADGTREVTYSSAAPWRVTYLPGEAEERTIEYGYDAANRLSAITQLGWPAAGQSASEQLLYDASGRLSRVNYANYDATTQPDAYLLIDYDAATNKATVTKYGRVNDVPNTALASEQLTWQAGTDLVKTVFVNAPEGQPDATYEYGYDEELYLPTSVEGPDGEELSEYDEYGNVISETDVNGEETTYDYAYPQSDLNGQLIAESGPAGETSYAHDPETGELTAEVATLGSGQRAITESTYDSQGRLTSEKKLISGTVTENIDVVPTMTSNSAPSGVASASTEYGSYLAWKAFDHVAEGIDHRWVSAGYAPQWCQYRFAAAKTVAQYSITSQSEGGGDGAPTAFTLQGSKDEQSWTTLDARAGLTWGAANVKKTFAIASPAAYLYYRLSITACQAAGWVALGEIELADGSYSVADGVWAETDYDENGYSANGEPLRTIDRGVRLSDGGTPQDLSTYRTYDAFGNLLTATDATGTRVTETNAYDLAARKLAETNAAGATTHHIYDVLGYESESWVSHASTQVKANWVKTTHDALGQASKEQYYLHDGTTETLQREVVRTYDGLGREITEDNGTVGGLPARSVYDERGNPIKEWAEGACQGSYEDARATRHLLADGTSSYDAENRPTRETEPGNTAPTITVYNADGTVSRETHPDGSFIAYTYDATGQVTKETRPRSGYAGNNSLVAETIYTYDASGRKTSETKPSGAVTTYGYDLLDRQTSAGAAGSANSTTTYNTLGWVLKTTDADGTAVRRTYDAAGHLLSEQRGTAQDESNGLVGTLMGGPAVGVTGGTVSTDGAYTVHKFTSSGTLVVPDGLSLEAQVLVVGGGGGGPLGSWNVGSGGGGAGGYLTANRTLSGSMPVVVGAGGHADANDAGNSSFGSLTAVGGGSGGGTGYGAGVGSPGGAGGGSAGSNKAVGSGTAGQGWNGGLGFGTYGITIVAGGGGGGIGGVGGAATSSATPGAGGAGVANSISGTSVTYARGGNGAPASGGAGVAGAANTGNGGGGGAGNNQAGAAGGSGVVIVRYLTAQAAKTDYTAASGWAGSNTPSDPSCLVFDGASDYVSFGDLASLDLGAGARALSAWVYLPSLPAADAVIFDKNDGTAGWTVVVAPSGVLYAIVDGGATYRSAMGTAALATGCWNHVVCTYSGSGGSWSFYVNGALAPFYAGGSPGAWNSDNAQPGCVGARSGGALCLNGKVAGLAVYSRTLTASEAAQLHAAGPAAVVLPVASDVVLDLSAGQAANSRPGSNGEPTRVWRDRRAQGLFAATQDPTTYAYDDAGRRLSETDPDGRIVNNHYDGFGNQDELRHTVSGNEVKHIDMTYDSLGRLTVRHDTVSGVRSTLAYPVNVEGGVTETLRYDAAGSTETTIARSSRGQEAQRETTAAGTPNLTLTRTVDARDDADRVTASTFTGSVFRSAYDGAGRISKQWGAGTSVDASTPEASVAAAYTYDSDTGLKDTDALPLPTAFGGAITNSFTYDAAGRLSVATIGGLAATHTFDAAGSLKRVVEGGVTSDFTYEGGRLILTTGAATTIYKWNAAQGWRTSQGPSELSQPITYDYTATGRLESYADAAASPAITAAYSYDAAGQRTRSVVTRGSAATTTDYRCEGLTLLGLSATTNGGASWKIDYLYDENGALYGGVYRDPAGSASPVAFAMVTTDRGDVVELIDAGGSPFAAYRYDVWGNPTSSPTQGTGLISAALAADIASRQILRYASYAYDAESKLYYCSARYYDPATRQWTTGDPAKADGEESAYQYCGGNPVNGLDPTGRRTKNFTMPIDVTRDYNSGANADDFYAKGYIDYTSSGNRWKVTRVVWNDRDESGSIVDSDAFFSTDADAYIQEHRSYGGTSTAWITVTNGYHDWDHWSMSRLGAGGIVNTPWDWKPDNPMPTKKNFWHNNKKSPGSRVHIRQNLRLIADPQGNIFRAYFEGYIKLPTSK